MLRRAGDFFKKFESFSPPTRSIKRACIEGALLIANVSLSEDNIDFRRGIIFVRTNPQAKSELMLRRQELVEYVNKVLQPSKRAVLDLR